VEVIELRNHFIEPFDFLGNERFLDGGSRR